MANRPPPNLGDLDDMDEDSDSSSSSEESEEEKRPPPPSLANMEEEEESDEESDDDDDDDVDEGPPLKSAAELMLEEEEGNSSFAKTIENPRTGSLKVLKPEAMFDASFIADISEEDEEEDNGFFPGEGLSSKYSHHDVEESPNTKPQNGLLMSDKKKPSIKKQASTHRVSFQESVDVKDDSPVKEDAEVEAPVEQNRLVDFNLWESFRAPNAKDSNARVPSISKRNLHADDEIFKEASPLDQDPNKKFQKAEADEIRKWTNRLQTQSFYKPDYRPVPRELRELDELLVHLKLKSDSSSSSDNKKVDKAAKLAAANMGEGELSPGINSLLSSTRPASSRMFFPLDFEPKSVLLKRGRVMLYRKAALDSAVEERELILLTHGIIIGLVENPRKERGFAGEDYADGGEDDATTPKKAGRRMMPRLNVKGVKKKNYEKIEMLSSIAWVEDLDVCRLPEHEGEDDVDAYDEASFAIAIRHEVEKGKPLPPVKRYVFKCTSEAQKKAWLDALEITILKEMRHFMGGVGWQYSLIRRSIYSAALLGNSDMMKRLLLPHPEHQHQQSKQSPNGSNEMLNVPDPYGSGAYPLHFSTMTNSMDCSLLLLSAGADPNAEDANNQTPFFFGAKLKDVGELLLQHGGQLEPPQRRGFFGMLGGSGNMARSAPDLAVAQAVMSDAPVSDFAFKRNKSEIVRKSPASATTPSGEVEEAGGGILSYLGFASDNATSEANANASSSTTQSHTDEVASLMAKNMKVLQERGEKLDTIDLKSSEMKDDAQNFKDLSSALKAKMQVKTKKFGKVF
mmetsp:Transcript_19306/g.35013  ORF Transcript_19306/g.35013 Transcript_19306/m.35013 type:complete len:796 (-) Transcript_19306:362-2749(-)